MKLYCYSEVWKIVILNNKIINVECLTGILLNPYDKLKSCDVFLHTVGSSQIEDYISDGGGFE